MNDHTMDILSKEGHTTTAWDPNNPAEVEAARATFDALTQRAERPYRAFYVGKRGQQGSRMESFDPAAEQMVLVPHVGGG